MIKYDLYLSYSGKKSYVTCPKQYEYKYILKEKAISNPKDILFGNIMGKIFEWFYNKKLWLRADIDSYLLNIVVDEAISECSSKVNFDLNSDIEFKSKLIKDVNGFVVSTLRVIRDQKLLSPISKSEIDLTSFYFDKESKITLKIGGRADFIHYFNNENIWIMDGKGSKYREKYIDSDQLIWYAVQHYIKYHIVPNRIGFLFYRFPSDPIKWIMLDDQLMREHVKRTIKSALQIMNGMFDPTPSIECRHCSFQSNCNDGIKYLADRRNKDGPFKSDIFDLEMVI